MTSPRYTCCLIRALICHTCHVIGLWWHRKRGLNLEVGITPFKYNLSCRCSMVTTCNLTFWISLLLSVFICTFAVLVLLWHMNYPSGRSIKDYLKFMFLFKSLWLTYDSVCFILGASNSVWIPPPSTTCWCRSGPGCGRQIWQSHPLHTAICQVFWNKDRAFSESFLWSFFTSSHDLCV